MQYILCITTHEWVSTSKQFDVLLSPNLIFCPLNIQKLRAALTVPKFYLHDT